MQKLGLASSLLTLGLGFLSPNFVHAQVSLVVEPPIVAPIIDSKAHDRLCGKLWEDQGGSYGRPAWGQSDCGGTNYMFETETHGRHRIKTWKGLVSGPQSFPHLNSKTLEAQILSALSDVPGVNVYSSEAIGKDGLVKRAFQEQNQFLLRTYLTLIETSLGESENSGGAVSIPLLSLLTAFERKETLGLVRLEIQLYSAETGEYVAAFPVVGEMSESELNYTFFGHSESNVSSKTTNSVGGALRNALSGVTEKLSEMTNRSGGA